METQELTVLLPRGDLEFAEKYAQAHQITVTELIDRYFRSLRDGSRKGAIHPDVEKLSGLVPAEVDVLAEYREYAARKYR